MNTSWDNIKNQLNNWINHTSDDHVHPKHNYYNPYSYPVDAIAVRTDLKNWDIVAYIRRLNMHHILICTIDEYQNNLYESVLTRFNEYSTSGVYWTTTGTPTGNNYNSHMPGFRGGKIPGTRKTPGRADGEVWE